VFIYPPPIASGMLAPFLAASPQLLNPLHWSQAHQPTSNGLSSTTPKPWKSLVLRVTTVS
jgi:hypothetical protein